MNLFPEVVLDSITACLSFHDTLRLYLSGDGLLRAKFEQGGVRSAHLMSDSICIPSCLKRFPNLTSYTHLIDSMLTELNFEASDASNIPPKLTKLVLNDSLQPTDFEALTPSLTHLGLSVMPRSKVDPKLWTFPSGLTTFQVKRAASTEVFPILNQLPSGLTSLSLTVYNVDLRARKLTNADHKFSSLRKLKIACSIAPMACNLPRNLTSLKLHILSDLRLHPSGTQYAPWTDFPKTLTDLQIRVPYLSLTPQGAMSFHKGMTRLSIIVSLGLTTALTTETIVALPRNLQKLKLDLLGGRASPLSLDMVKSLPPNLGRLSTRISSDDMANEILQLQNLRKINFLEIPMNSLGQLPSSLTEIIGMHTTADSIAKAAIFSAEASQLPKLFKLDLTLSKGPCAGHLPFSFPSSLQCLNLICHFGWIHLDCIPKKLLELVLEFWHDQDAIQPPDDWLMPLRHLPLQRLSIAGIYLTKKHLSALKGEVSRKFEHLDFYTELRMEEACSDWHDAVANLQMKCRPPSRWKEALERLPKKLQHLSLQWVKDGTPVPEFTTDHIAVLPPTLRALTAPIWGNPRDLCVALQARRIINEGLITSSPSSAT